MIIDGDPSINGSCSWCANGSDMTQPAQVRAYALMAAANMLAGTAGLHPHAEDITAWEDRVLATARRFEHHINGADPGATEGSEDS